MVIYDSRTCRKPEMFIMKIKEGFREDLLVIELKRSHGLLRRWNTINVRSDIILFTSQTISNLEF